VSFRDSEWLPVSTRRQNIRQGLLHFDKLNIQNTCSHPCSNSQHIGSLQAADHSKITRNIAKDSQHGQRANLSAIVVKKAGITRDLCKLSSASTRKRTERAVSPTLFPPNDNQYQVSSIESNIDYSYSTNNLKSNQHLSNK
jgi:hypothetical protein